MTDTGLDSIGGITVAEFSHDSFREELGGWRSLRDEWPADQNSLNWPAPGASTSGWRPAATSSNT